MSVTYSRGDWRRGDGLGTVEATQGDFFALTKNSMNPIFTVRLQENSAADSESREGAVRVRTIGGSGTPADTVVFFRQVGTGAAGVSVVSTPNLNQVQYVSAAKEGSVSLAISLSGEADEFAAVLGTNPGTFL